MISTRQEEFIFACFKHKNLTCGEVQHGFVKVQSGMFVEHVSTGVQTVKLSYICNKGESVALELRQQLNAYLEVRNKTAAQELENWFQRWESPQRTPVGIFAIPRPNGVMPVPIGDDKPHLLRLSCDVWYVQERSLFDICKGEIVCRVVSQSISAGIPEAETIELDTDEYDY
ncbi:MAG: hypothetical protein KME42_14130 [Tildeniella nuda ZEHNDER 1965/U140]|jgi:hypothetical protein|nr:hypothetical protein [Tildeniella nuda ZEHNDER 1965/U140]